MKTFQDEKIADTRVEDWRPFRNLEFLSIHHIFFYFKAMEGGNGTTQCISTLRSVMVVQR